MMDIYLQKEMMNIYKMKIHYLPYKILNFIYLKVIILYVMLHNSFNYNNKKMIIF